jgi:hypothetical protein
MTRIAITAVAALTLLAGGASTSDPSLDRLLACQDRAAGGAALRAVNRIEYDLAIEEQGHALTARYRAVREGIAGRMRIDVFAAGTRVYSEWWDGRQAWQLPQAAEQAVQSHVEGSEALRRGLEQPGHFWTLADMPRNGHSVALESADSAGGTVYQVVKLTLADGFTTWYWVNPASCRIERSRNFRAFHPDQDTTKNWVEVVHENFRSVDGITRPFRERTIDVPTGDVVATARILALRVDPPFNSDSLSVP